MAKSKAESGAPDEHAPKMQCEVTMQQRKTTKGTVVYDADSDNAAVRTVYVAKHALGDNPPASIQLMLAWPEN